MLETETQLKVEIDGNLVKQFKAACMFYRPKVSMKAALEMLMKDWIDRVVATLPPEDAKRVRGGMILSGAKKRTLRPSRTGTQG